MQNLTIINSKENTLDFDLEIDGIDGDPAKISFVIKTTEVDFAFKCKKVEGNLWRVVIPAMPQIENTLYNYSIEVVIDGYYFEPTSGQINVIKSADLYVKDIKNKTFKPEVEESIKPNEINTIIKKIKANPVKEKSTNIIAAKILKEVNLPKKKSAIKFKKITENSDTIKENIISEADKKITKILKETKTHNKKENHKAIKFRKA